MISLGFVSEAFVTSIPLYNIKRGTGDGRQTGEGEGAPETGEGESVPALLCRFSSRNLTRLRSSSLARASSKNLTRLGPSILTRLGPRSLAGR